MVVCQNCGFEGEQKFCSRCGQVLEVRRITLAQVLAEVVNNFTHFEKGYLFTLKKLFLQPGTMQRRYLSGIRLNYQKPFPFFTISGSVCALALFLIYRNAASTTDQYFYKNYYFLVQVVMLPVYALLTYLLFYSSRLNYAESLVLNVYMLGFMSLCIIPVNLLSFVFGNGTVSLLEVVCLVIYNTWTYLNFFKGKAGWWVLLKAILFLVISYSLFQFAAFRVMDWFM